MKLFSQRHNLETTRICTKNSSDTDVGLLKKKNNPRENVFLGNIFALLICAELKEVDLLILGRKPTSCRWMVSSFDALHIEQTCLAWVVADLIVLTKTLRRVWHPSKAHPDLKKI